MMFRWLAARQYRTEVRENIRFIFRSFEPGLVWALERLAFSGRLNRALSHHYDERTPAISAAVTAAALYLEHFFDQVPVELGRELVDEYIEGEAVHPTVIRFRKVAENVRQLTSNDAERNLIEYTIVGGLKGYRGKQAFEDFRWRCYMAQLTRPRDMDDDPEI